MKKEIYILIGPGAIGKTTYITNIGFPKEKLAIISRDEIVESICKKYEVTNDELFLYPPHNATPGELIIGQEQYGKVIESPAIVAHLHPFSFETINSYNVEIHEIYYDKFREACENPAIDYIILDRVHMRLEERQKYFPYIESNRKDFFVTATLFNFQDADTLDIIGLTSQIRTERMKQEGVHVRSVPQSVQENMLKFYVEPTLEEGFDSIVNINTLPVLKDNIKKYYSESCFHQDGTCPLCEFEMIQIKFVPADFFDKSRKYNCNTAVCPSCKNEFGVYESIKTDTNPGRFKTFKITEDDKNII